MNRKIKRVHNECIDTIDARKQSAGNWVFERSSGYAGWRCAKCGVWIYDKQPCICDCDKKIMSLYL